MIRFRFTILTILALTLGACSTSEHLSQTAPEIIKWESVATPTWYDDKAHDTISVVTWNIEHFVDKFDSPYIDNDRENNPPEDMDERRELFAEAIKKMDADIVVLQEVESAAYMQVFAEQHFPDLNYRYFTGRESNDWYMNVVVMSRIPLGMLYSYANPDSYIVDIMDDDGQVQRQNFTNNRMLSVDVLVNPDYSFLLTGLHLKAGRGERNENWRIGQIDLLRDHFEYLTTVHPDMRFLIAGDLNILPGDREFLHLLGDDDSPIFIDPLSDVDSFTHTSDNPVRQLDHLLPNEKMMEDLVPRSAEIAMPFDPEAMRKISDHLPVIARFVTTE
ncbi:endonuclease/exonuclease/phosphatase family protein [Rhodohalobacter barkolensis]|uniref:Endonuclease/exonuclease/phosphatase family protein n=1 Tax=Rhodohalobacter barkolensis TaxID=2053187 RepID=A0A2N0VHY3_9BACT|nr:endonuclease/exonuclease/phosphatase family protein [Rhodohalobacter barkolensis]PKD43802.1 endonuclease/exonuclease/phosphatase family protein [Rhodohalobacter barkolensis]